MKSLLINFNAPLSNEIKNNYNKLIEEVLEIPLVQRRIRCLEGTGGKVSISDIIAYQIGWGILLINWYQSGIHNKKIQMPGEGFYTWDYKGLAKHFYEKFSYDKAEQQLIHFHDIVNKILDITEKEYATGNLNTLGVWDWCTLASGKQWPLSKWIKINTIAPYKRALSLIRKIKSHPKDIENI